MTAYHITPASTASLRSELAWLRARHDSGAVSVATYAVIKELEEEISWRAHARSLKVEEGT